VTTPEHLVTEPRISGVGKAAARALPRANPFANRVFREMSLVVLGMSVLAVVMTWPALHDPAHAYPGVGVDPLIEIWSIAWSGHALASVPLSHVFDANAFYPAQYSLAFTDSLLGYGPITWFSGGPGRALVDYNIIFAATPALAGSAGYALARQVGADPLGAAVAGLGLAYAPWRTAQIAHLHVLSTGPFLAALAMLARGHGLSLRGRKGKPRPLWALAGWLAAAWQVTIGFAVGLPFAYLMAIIALVVIVVWPVRHWRRLPPWRLVAADVMGGAVFAAATLAMAQPYLKVAETQRGAVEAARGLAIVARYSPTWRGLLAPPSDYPTVWSWLNAHVLAGYSTSGETRVLPGFTLIALALIGLFVSAWRLQWRLTLAAGVAVASALALGTHLAGNGEVGYVFLWRHAPGFGAERTPGRLVMFAAVGLALLAAGAVTRLAEPAPATAGGARVKPGTLRLAAAALLPVLVLAEGFTSVPESRPPPVPTAMRYAPGPMVVLPSVWTFDSTVMAWSAQDGFKRIANGQSGITPLSLQVMRKQMGHFPDAKSVRYLRVFGFRSVVVLKNQVNTPLWARARADRAPRPSLGLRRIDMGDSVLFLVEPKPAP
jgi:hypothetical protein